MSNPRMYRFENKKIPVSTFLNYEFKLFNGLDKEDFEINCNLIERMLLNVDTWNNGTCNIRGIINVEKDTFEILDKQTLSIVETLICQKKKHCEHSAFLLFKKFIKSFFIKRISSPFFNKTSIEDRLINSSFISIF